MNYLDDQRCNALASEYVLGTLRGPARIRFQHLLMQHPSMRQTLWRWEGHLNALGGSLPSQPLPPYVWEKIQQRLGFAEQPSSSTKLESSGDNIVQLRPNTAKNAIKPWQWATAFSAAAALLFAVLLFTPQQLSSPIFKSQLAIVQSEKAQALWVIELTNTAINVQATEKLQAQQNQDYELWLVAKDGRAPVSLGLLPKNGKLILPRSALIGKVEIAALAVSLEPLGGSPNGQPTKVLYTAELVAI